MKIGNFVTLSYLSKLYFNFRYFIENTKIDPIYTEFIKFTYTDVTLSAIIIILP